MASSYLTLMLVCVIYLGGYMTDNLLSDFDKGILRTLCTTSTLKPSRVWEPALRRAVLSFSDQQLVTGIALLASGYSQLSYGLSAYHWQIVAYLAWFSSVTHMATLTALRQYFRDHPALRFWRSMLMVLTVLMLVLALLPTGSGWWYPEFKAPGIPAICYFKQLNPRGGWIESVNSGAPYLPTMMISMLGLLFGLLTRLMKLSSKATTRARLRLRTKPGYQLKKMSDLCLRHSTSLDGKTVRKVAWLTAYIMIETLYVTLRVVFDLFESVIAEVRLLV